jgi:hypothetical protein
MSISRKALDDSLVLRSYISENGPSAAQRLALYILHQVEAVFSDNPWPRCWDTGDGRPKLDGQFFYFGCGMMRRIR